MSSQQEINTSNNSYDELMTKIKKWGQGEQIVPVIRDIPKEETLIRKALKNPGVLVSSTPEIKGNSRCYVCFFSIKNKIKLPDNRNAIIGFSITERDKWAIQDASNYIHDLLSIKSFDFILISKPSMFTASDKFVYMFEMCGHLLDIWLTF